MLLLAAALVGCAPAPAQVALTEWTLDAPGSQADGPVRLPARLGDRLPDRPSTYRLRATVAVPQALRGEDVDILLPSLPARTRLRADGRLLPSLYRDGATGYRRAGPHGWRVPAERTTDGRLDLVLSVDHTFTQSAWLDVPPRLGPAGLEGPLTVAVRWVNGIGAAVAAVAMLQVGFIYLAVFLVDRRRRAYLWFAAQGIAAGWYPLYVTGYTQHLFGHWDLNVLAVLLAVAPIVSIWFTHAHYGLPSPSRLWLVLLGIAAIVPWIFHDPFATTQAAGKVTVAAVMVTVVYQVQLLTRLSLQRGRFHGASILLTAWIVLGVGASVDAMAWSEIAEPLDGLRTGMPALAVFAVLQALHLGREHIHSLNRSDELNVELAGRVALLETRQSEIQHLNTELRRQIADRSGQLMSALALMGGRGGQAPSLSVDDVIEERYRVVGHLGTGGMGAVYRVERLADGRRLALKVTRELDGLALARLAREAQIAAQLDHPNVVTILDVDVAQSGFLYMVMDLVDGPSLRQRRQRFGDVPWGLGVLEQVARGLHALHSCGIVHRDLKPANVLLAEADPAAPTVKITDFGISRLAAQAGQAAEPSDSTAPTEAKEHDTQELATATMPLRPERTPSSPAHASAKSRPASLTQTGLLAGTPEYLAPELADGPHHLAPAADVFSLGILAHEVLFRERPYAEPAVLVALRDGSIPPPPPFGATTGALESGAAEVLARCLSWSPAARPSAEEVADALAEARRSGSEP